MVRSRQTRLPQTSARLPAALIDKKSSRQNFATPMRHPRDTPEKADCKMAQRAAVRTTYEIDRTLQPIYSGGSLSLSEDGRILAASLGEDVLLTNLANGKELGRIEGDGEAITSLSCKFTAQQRLSWAKVCSNAIGIPSHHWLAIALFAHIRCQYPRRR